MYYTVYKITSLLDSRYYIGVHKTLNPHDSYFGSGIHIKAAIRKYGKTNFMKEVLFIFDNPEEAFSKEKELVNKHTLTQEMFNKTTGGSGGGIDWTTRNRKILRGPEHHQFNKSRTDAERLKISKSLKESYKIKPRDASTWEKTANAKRGKPSPLRGLIQSAESNAKRSLAHLNIQKKICMICGRHISPSNFNRHVLTH